MCQVVASKSFRSWEFSSRDAFFAPKVCPVLSQHNKHRSASRASKIVFGPSVLCCCLSLHMAATCGEAAMSPALLTLTPLAVAEGCCELSLRLFLKDVSQVLFFFLFLQILGDMNSTFSLV